MKRTPMTLRGAGALRTELKRLKSEGEVVDVAAPGGTRSYEIVAVRLA